MANLDFRALRADEVEVRFDRLNAKTNATGAFFLLYKDARCDMRILDDIFGSFGWQRQHKELKGNLYCDVSILDTTTGEWVTKSDCGDETQVEAAKGEASDAFKRACFNWGIGRELYTAPKIEIMFNSDYEKQKQNIYGLHVSKMIVDEHKISELELRDKFDKVRFHWAADAAKVAEKSATGMTKIPSKSEAMADIVKKLALCETKDALAALWGIYPIYQHDEEFRALFTARKNELGIN